MVVKRESAVSKPCFEQAGKPELRCEIEEPEVDGSLVF